MSIEDCERIFLALMSTRSHAVTGADVCREPLQIHDIHDMICMIVFLGQLGQDMVYVSMKGYSKFNTLSSQSLHCTIVTGVMFTRPTMRYSRNTMQCRDCMFAGLRP